MDRHSLTSLLMLIAAVAMALAIIALQPQPPAMPRAAATATGLPACDIEPICVGAAPAQVAAVPCAASGCKSGSKS